MVPKIRNRGSDGPISRFRFCSENVERSFVMCSHGPIFRTNKESSIWRQNDHRDIMQNLSAPFIFQEDCRMKIEHALFPSVFSKLQIRVSEGKKNKILKNGSCERALTHATLLAATMSPFYCITSLMIFLRKCLHFIFLGLKDKIKLQQYF